ncbi:hypothetical protein [Paenibacillus sp. 32352]|uniref:hypothetical protein n=1 Tax=Paenibacillus sp. 32352 TaxID=1969111 RepID=UPI0009AC16FF|nr:hypothetical protein [Paenibacillus sp. 32352]
MANVSPVRYAPPAAVVTRKIRMYFISFFPGNKGGRYRSSEAYLTSVLANFAGKQASLFAEYRSRETVLMLKLSVSPDETGYFFKIVLKKM